MTQVVSTTSESQTLSMKLEEDAHRRNLEVLVAARNVSGGANHVLACDQVYLLLIYIHHPPSPPESGT